jgi:hypothetical protein
MLYAETVGGANVVNDVTMTGQVTYSTVGACEWNAQGLGQDEWRMQLTAGTICGVSATAVQAVIGTAG